VDVRKTIVRPCAFAELEKEPNIAELGAEYAAESTTAELGPANPQWRMYEALEAAGVAKLLCAYHGEAMVGFLLLLVSVVPHFGLTIATTESFFVARAARKSGAGLMLRREAERMARDMGAVGFFISAPMGSRLAEVMGKAKGWRETNRVFFRGLA
jgi:GNAT superfamily N-acetyltransferase